MSRGLISGNGAPFHLCTTPSSLCRRSTAEAIFFNTHHPKLSISIENRSGSFRNKAAINDGFIPASLEMNFYELLGISESGSFSEIKQAYKQLARKYHPDVSPPDRIEENTKRFIQVQEAYETLSDPNMRALYDRDLSGGLHLAFSARNGHRFDEGLEERYCWRSNWESQLEGLKRRSMKNDDSRENNISWGARMRRRRNESSANL